MPGRRLLDTTSLATTLWNLEEARLAGETAATPRVAQALEWVVDRHHQPRAYAGLLFAPTAIDLNELRAIPTGEGGGLGKAGVTHILGEEAVRCLELWGVRDGWDRDEVVDHICRKFRSNPSHGKVRPGYFCCLRCSVARWRAIAAARPTGWRAVLEDAARILGEADLTGSGRWVRWPFHYTVLALSEFPDDLAAPQRKRIRDAAERLLPRLKGTDRVVGFRRRALQWAVG
jgi:hypothetical protein